MSSLRARLVGAADAVLWSTAGVLLGAAFYTHHDIFFSTIGYVWLAAWYTLCMVDALLMKKITDTVPMSTWSRTLYNVRLYSMLSYT